jgi:hypothetical protein
MIGKSQGEPPFPVDFYLSWMSRLYLEPGTKTGGFLVQV